MKALRFLAALPILALVVVAATPSAQAQPTNPRQVSVGGVIDVLLQNTTVQIPVNVRQNQIGLVNLNDVLNNAEIQVLNNALNGPILSNNRIIVQDVLNNNEIVKDVLNNSNIVIGEVVAVDVLSGGRLTIFYLPVAL